MNEEEGEEEEVWQLGWGAGEEKGCDYILNYYEQPSVSLPASWMDMAARRAVNNSHQQMHQAALGLTSVEKQ